jgi:hypothetical protein
MGETGDEIRGGEYKDLDGSMLGFLMEGLMPVGLLKRSTDEPRMPAPKDGLRWVGESGVVIVIL